MDKHKQIFEKEYYLSPEENKRIRDKVKDEMSNKKRFTLDTVHKTINDKEVCRQTIKDNATNKEFKIPQNYFMGKDGVILFKRLSKTKNKTNVEWKEITRTPMIISDKARNVKTGIPYIVLLGAYDLNTDYTEIIIPREDIKTFGITKQLARHDLDIDQNKYKGIITYLSAFENCNVYRVKKSYSHLGYVGNKAYLPFYNMDDKIIDTVQQGFNELYEGVISTSGKAETQFDLFNDMIRHNYPYNNLLISAYVSGLFLKMFEGNGLTIHLYGKTGTGKSTFFNFLNSLTGNPEILHTSLSSTENGLVRKLSFFRTIPLCADELTMTKRQNGIDVDALLYMSANGKEKDRLNKDLEFTGGGDWRTILFTNSEHAIIKRNSESGAVNRVVEVLCDNTMYPENFSGNRINRIIKSNYGHFTRALIEHVFTTYSNEDLINMYDTINEDLVNHFIYKEVYEEKQLNMLSVILFGNKLLQGFDKVDAPELKDKDIVGFLKEKQDVNINAKAFDYLIDQISKNLNKFTNDFEILDRWGVITDDYVFILPSEFDEILTKGGYNPDTLKRYMKDNDLIDYDGKDAKSNSKIKKERRLTKTTRAFDTKTKRMIAIINFNQFDEGNGEQLFNPSSYYEEENENK